MTDNEKELIKLIHDNDNPQQALALAMELMIEILEKYGVSQDTYSEPHREAS